MSQTNRPSAFDRTGEVIAGRYELCQMIEKGGQGVVYRARDLKDGDDVAVKVMKREFAQDSEWRERMFREARAMTMLTGTSAVKVFDQRWTDDGALCLVMEYLRGMDFEEYLHRREHKGTRLDVSTLVSILDPVVRTLDAAHDHAIIHRDIKPANIFITDGDIADGNRVRLLDFGFAKFSRLRSFTAAGTVPGSPSYIAPETWLGKQSDHRVDLYALGAVIFRALAGAPPFMADTVAELLKRVTNDPRPSLHEQRPDLPPAVDRWVEQALAIDRELRFLRARAMWAAFKDVVR